MLEEQEITSHKSVKPDQNFHNKNFCLLLHFSSSQHFKTFNADSKIIVPCTIILQQEPIVIFHEADFSSYSHRGPPQLS
ncbi:MAG: hypothetical protein EHM47_11270 [Ignavibacteriales bacterium]|nr:MAG: hypothetical protein EHM47_11270 [Ignavibacteriales bacterium]